MTIVDNILEERPELVTSKYLPSRMCYCKGSCDATSFEEGCPSPMSTEGKWLYITNTRYRSQTPVDSNRDLENFLASLENTP